MSRAEDAKLVRAVDQFARTATDRIAARWTAQGAIAQPGTPNPYRPGTHAFDCWQRGQDMPRKLVSLTRQRAATIKAGNVPRDIDAEMDRLRAAIAKTTGGAS